MLPWLLPGSFYVAIATHVLVAAVLALSLNILIGYCGMSSLGHAVYLGVPAYLPMPGWLATQAWAWRSRPCSRWGAGRCWRRGSGCWRCGRRAWAS